MLIFILTCIVELFSVIYCFYIISMDKLQYPQKFRNERLLESSFKSWLLKIENNNTKCRCQFYKIEVNAKHFDLVQHAKSKKHQESSKAFFTSRSMASFVQ